MPPLDRVGNVEKRGVKDDVSIAIRGDGRRYLVSRVSGMLTLARGNIERVESTIGEGPLHRPHTFRDAIDGMNKNLKPEDV